MYFNSTLEEWFKARCTCCSHGNTEHHVQIPLTETNGNIDKGKQLNGGKNGYTEMSFSKCVLESVNCT